MIVRRTWRYRASLRGLEATVGIAKPSKNLLKIGLSSDSSVLFVKRCALTDLDLAFYSAGEIKCINKCRWINSEAVWYNVLDSWVKREYTEAQEKELGVFLSFGWASEFFHSVQKDVGNDARVGGCDVAGHLHYYWWSVDVVSNVQKQMSQPAYQHHAGYSHHALGRSHLSAWVRMGFRWYLRGPREIWLSSNAAVLGSIVETMARWLSVWRGRSKHTCINVVCRCRISEIFWGGWTRDDADRCLVAFALKSLSFLFNHLLGLIRVMTPYTLVVLKQSDDNLGTGEYNPSHR